MIRSQRHLLLFLLALSVATIRALPTSPSLLASLKSVIRSSDSDSDSEFDSTVASEIQCYSLPYGAIGIVSHLLNYWTVYWLGHCRKPYFPFSKLKKTKFDVATACVQLIITMTIAILTMVRCQHRWQFVLVAFWKLLMSLVIGVWVISSARRAATGMHSDTRHVYSAPWRSQSNKFMWLYFVGTGIGAVGLISLVKENWDDIVVEAATLLFAAWMAFTVALVLVMAILFRCTRCCKYEGGGCFGFLTWSSAELCWSITVFWIAWGAFYCDVVMGELADDLLGLPTGKEAVPYWIYFAAKRLAFISS